MIVEHVQNSITQAILEYSDHEAVDKYLCEDNVHYDDEFEDRNLITLCV